MLYALSRKVLFVTSPLHCLYWGLVLVCIHRHQNIVPQGKMQSPTSRPIFRFAYKKLYGESKHSLNNNNLSNHDDFWKKERIGVRSNSSHAINLLIVIPTSSRAKTVQGQNLNTPLKLQVISELKKLKTGRKSGI